MRADQTAVAHLTDRVASTAEALARLFDPNSPVTPRYANRWHLVGSVCARRRARRVRLVMMGAGIVGLGVLLMREAGDKRPGRKRRST